MQESHTRLSMPVPIRYHLVNIGDKWPLSRGRTMNNISQDNEADLAAIDAVIAAFFGAFTNKNGARSRPLAYADDCPMRHRQGVGARNLRAGRLHRPAREIAEWRGAR